MNRPFPEPSFPSLTITSADELQTLEFGQQLARVLKPGLTVALDGQLGSGKTNLVRAICRFLGADETYINSPTFVLMQAYMDGRLPVYHFDTFRLGDADEFLAIGAEDYLNNPEAICFVEWASRFREVLPIDRLTIMIEQTGETSRRFTLQAGGPRSAEILQQLGLSIPQR